MACLPQSYRPPGLLPLLPGGPGSPFGPGGPVGPGSTGNKRPLNHYMC